MTKPKPRPKPLLSWPDPTQDEARWLRANGAVSEKGVWVLHGDTVDVGAGVPVERLRLFVNGEVEVNAGGFHLQRHTQEGAIFLPQSLIDDAAERAGGKEALEEAVGAALERYLHTIGAVNPLGMRTINLDPPRTSEWQHIGVTHIPKEVAEKIDRLPFSVHVLLAAALLTETDWPLMQVAPGAEKVYPFLPFPARRLLLHYRTGRDGVCSRLLTKLLNRPLGEIAERVATTWVQCSQVTLDNDRHDDTINLGGG